MTASSYATDFLPRMDGAGCPRGRGRLGFTYGGLGRAFARNYVLRSSLEYPGLRGEGSNPDPLPPAPSSKPHILRGSLWAIKPIAAAISHFSSGLLLARARSLFSERPNFLRSSGLRGFGTVLEIPTFQRAYESQRRDVLWLLSDRRERPLPIRHIAVRILSLQPGSPRFREFPSLDEKGPLNAGFSHRH
jgi:hypothetical protein